MLPGTEISDAKFYVDKDNTWGYSGDLIVTAVRPSVPIEGIQAITVEFQGNGALSVGNIG